MAHILVVDDEVEIRGFIADALTNEGHVVSQAGDGREAMEKIRADPQDLIITDILMLVWDGIDLMISLTREGRKVPVIAMTGIPPELVPYLRIAHRLGAVRTLSKPFNISELLKVTKEAIAWRSAKRTKPETA